MIVAAHVAVPAAQKQDQPIALQHLLQSSDTRKITIHKIVSAMMLPRAAHYNQTRDLIAYKYKQIISTLIDKTVYNNTSIS